MSENETEPERTPVGGSFLVNTRDGEEGGGFLADVDSFTSRDGVLTVYGTDDDGMEWSRSFRLDPDAGVYDPIEA